MSKKSNIKLESNDSLSTIIASGDFSGLTPDIQKQVIQYNLNKHKMEAGILGKFFGTKNTGIHVAFTLCAFFLIIIIVDMFYCYCSNKSINLDLISLTSPFFTLALGYIFGKENHD